MLLLVALAPAQASASENAKEPIHFEYVAAPACPPADRFLGQISAYTTRWSIAASGEEARRFSVRIGPRNGAFVGHLEVREANGSATRRDIEGANCDDTALGVAVAVALAIDPNAMLAPPSPPPTESGGLAGSPAPAPPPKDEEPAPVARVPVEPKPSARSHVAVSAGGRGEANGAVSGVLAVLDVFLELEWLGASRRVPSLRPAIRGGWRIALDRTTQVGRSRAEIGWSAGYLEVCPARFAVTRRIAVEGCAGANLGVLSAQPPEIRGAGITRLTWFDYGALLGARWHVHRHVFVEAVMAVWAPITRDRLHIEPDGVVTRAPAAGISAGIGGGWRF